MIGYGDGLGGGDGAVSAGLQGVLHRGVRREKRRVKAAGVFGIGGLHGFGQIRIHGQLYRRSGRILCRGQQLTEAFAHRDLKL